MNRTLKLLSSVFFLFLSLALHAQSSYCDSVKTIFSNTPGIGTTNYNPDDLVVSLDSAFGATHYDSTSAQYLPNTLSYWFAQLLICGDSCTHIVSCDSINTAISQLSSYQIVPDSTTSYSLPFIENYLSIRFPAYQLDKPSWDAILHCCAPPSVNFNDTLLQRCDTTAIVRFVLQNNIPSVDSCLPYWVYNYIMTEIGFGVDSNIYQLCNDLTNCNIKCLPFCTDTFPTACDSLNSVYYVYRQLLASEQTGGIPSSDTTLLEKTYSALYGQYLPPGQVMAEIATCNQDSSLITVITYSVQNVHYSTVSGQTFIDLDVFAIDTPQNLLFSQGNIFLQFDSTIFGTNLVSSGKITASKGQAIDSPYYNVSITDSLPNMIKLSVTHTPNPTSLANLDSVNQQLCHLKINVSGFNLTSVAAAFDTLAMTNRSQYKRTIYGLEAPYDIVRVSGLVGALRSQDADSINFSITNATLDNPTSPAYLDFDIIGSATIPNVNLGGYNVKVRFDEYTFDNATVTNIITNGCGDDGMGSGGGGCCGGDSIYDFNWTYVPGSVNISLAYNYNYDPTDSDMAQVYDQIQGATPLAHVRLHISDCHYLPNVIIDPSIASAEWEDTSILSFVIYSPTYIGHGFTDTICTPVPNIIAWSPECTNAGDFQEVTIWGEHFGDSMGTVYFTNANNPNTYVHTLPQDIRHWENDTIRLLIPSALSSDPTLGTAGSGYFYVQTASGLNDSTDHRYISIGYANFNLRGIDSGARFVYLMDTPYVFQLSSNLFYTAGVMPAVESVLANLRCQTGINFWLDTINPAPVDTPNASDGVNLISMQPNNANVFSHLDSNAYGITVKEMIRTPNAPSQYNGIAYYVSDIDISLKEIPPTPQGSTGGFGWNWWLYFTNTSIHVYDAATVLTHELGHAACMSHTQPKEATGYNIMYPKLPPQFCQRYYDLDQNTLLGIKHILSIGDTMASYGCHASAAVAFLDSCPTVNPTTCVQNIDGIQPVHVSSTGFSASLYPNPYQDNTIVHVDVSAYGNFTIIASDMIGQILMQKSISTSTSFDVPLSGFSNSAGMYLIQVSDAHSNITFKLIKL